MKTDECAQHWETLDLCGVQATIDLPIACAQE